MEKQEGKAGWSSREGGGKAVGRSRGEAVGEEAGKWMEAGWEMQEGEEGEA